MEKKTTQMIKGLAILIMIMHHFCATTLFPNINPNILRFGQTCKICVAIYAVLSGYGYYFAKEKSVKYGLRKIGGLLQIYWISLFTLFIPVAVQGGWKCLPKTLFIQLFGLLPNLNWYAWYVFFYIFCMLVMPFVYKIFRFNFMVNLAIALVVPYGLEVACHLVPNYESITAIHDLFSCFLYFPCFLVGYLMAQHKLIEKLNRKKSISTICSIIGMIIVFVIRYVVAWLNINTFGFLLDVFYAPAFIYFASNVFTGIGKCKAIQNIFSTLGKYSTGMWFFHAVFFSTYVCDIFQPILLLVKWPVLMFVWLVLLSLAGAFIYQKILDGIKSVPRVLKRSS